ncbi:serine/threonine protein kinase [Trypanosoma cruzi Dm28c]|uniref:non-specific serine/threonine protein kinase n=2 Tax=Trypanosoma cruzi TaxID=5693 RepID=V5BPJ0_TRYCR|nr:serine/threonine protein kinase [Trypanosoma cruzi Dm28c]KAF8293585.1 putative Serine/threonine-protein kinase NEK17 [Trypanosoma cruzi]PBJ75680.1 serine/threonine protein kinase [Trypanosoma cruzi cruzi]PWU90748.1 putative serine/threonine protein kinase [Trypanosoma cruzi]PWU90749.1 putative serine/threonine protein kinase [Trypanosoma cruzi]
MPSGDAMIPRVCRTFSDAFASDEATAKEQGKKYWISRVLGSGATGTVLCAKRRSDGQSFAVKVVEMEGMSEADKNRAQAEVQCLLNCDFFSILKCHEDFAKKDPADEENVLMVALVLDYANAGDLRQEIKNRAKAARAFREHEAGLLFIQVLLAIHHVHSRHMIHRDIKTANILLCSNGLVKLGDFGFSKMYSATVSGDVGKTFCGTPYYVAPEIWRRKPYSKKADIFSLGVLLYELLTLKRPFDGENMQEVMQKALAGRYDPLPPTISPEMTEVVTSLLCGDPHARPSSSKLLNMPICKLFVSGLLEIVQTQPSFAGPLRDTISTHIQSVKQSLKEERRVTVRQMEESQSAAAASTTILEGATPMGSVGDLTLYEGIVKKQSGDLAWKRRYLCIRGALEEGERLDAGRMPKFKSLDLVLAVSKETMRQQCITTPFSELEDVFPVASKYTGSNAQHVFAVAFKTGRRLLFQARGDPERDAWMQKIQQTLGIDEAD